MHGKEGFPGADYSPNIEQYSDKKGPSSPDEVEAPRRGSVTDAVFGEITEGGPNYRDVGWIGTVGLMLKTQIGLGVLSIPVVFNVLGMLPGVLVLLAVAITTTWSDYVVGTFKLRHPEVYGIDDVGGLIFGRAGYIFMAVAFCLFWIFVAAAGQLGISIALNAISLHGACTAIFVVIGATVGFLGSSIQTLGKMTWLVWAGVIGIMVAIFTVTVAVGVQDRPAAAPQEGPWKSDWKMYGDSSMPEVFAAVSSIVFAYSGTCGFFSLISEMRDPRKYSRSVIACQSIVTLVYLLIGIVVYYFVGSYVADPALGSAGPVLKRIAYGFGIIGLMASTILLSHIPAKYAFVRILKGSRHLTNNTPTHWMVWFGCTFTVSATAYLIASGIPVFGALISLVGALLGTLLSYQPMGFMYLYDARSASAEEKKTLRWKLQCAWAVFIIVSGTFLMIAGTYGSVIGVIDASKGGVWSCADNSNSV